MVKRAKSVKRAPKPKLITAEQGALIIAKLEKLSREVERLSRSPRRKAA